MTIRKLRHWRQQFEPSAEFVFRRPVLWGETQYMPGDKVPPSLQENTKKLRLHWEARSIELAEFDEPRGVTKSKENGDLPDYVTQCGSWYHVDMPDGETMKVQGRANLEELLSVMAVE